MMSRGSKIAALTLGLLVCCGYASATLDRGHQILIDKGLQIQAQIYPITAGSFNLSRWAESNFTTANTASGISMDYLGLPPGMPWGRLVEMSPPWDYLYSDEEADAANMVSMQVGDEQSVAGSNLTEISRLLAAWRAAYPTVLGYTNQSGGQETVAAMQAYMAAAQPDMVMMDSYPFFTTQPGGSPTAYYQALQKYRLLGLAGNNGTGATPIPYGTYLQGAQWGSSGHVISDSEVRLGEFAAWTFGYKFAELWYYNNTGLDTYPNVMFVNQDETMPTSVFYSYAAANLQSRNLGPTLVRLLSTDLRFIAGQNNAGGTTVNNTLPSGISAWDNTSHPYITAIAATNLGSTNSGLRGDVVVGYFKPLRAQDSPGYPNEPYFMILNGLTDPNGTASQSQQSIRIDFNFATSGITSLQRLNPDNGTVEVVPLIADGGSKYHLNLVLDGGTADLFKFNSGAPFVTGNAGGPWTDVTYQDNTVKANINGGADKAGSAYTSTKPDNGTWAFAYNLSGSTSVSAFSAKYVKFLSSGPSAEKNGVLGGQDNMLVIKVSLSKYATSAVWDAGSIGYNVAAGSSVQLMYSTNGSKYTTVYTSPTGTGSAHPSGLSLTFPGGTKTIYLAYAGSLGSGTQAYWNAASGSLTITPDPRLFDEWVDISYSGGGVQANVNGGSNTGGYAYSITSTPPGKGDWSDNFSLGSSGGTVKVWSAKGMDFQSSTLWTTDYGTFEDTQCVFKLNFSQPINAVKWSMYTFYYVLNPGNTIEAKWSVDGVNWTTCYTFPQIDPEYPNYWLNPAPVTFAVPSTTVLYLGWFGTLGTGHYCSYQAWATGSIVYQPVNKTNWNAVTYMLSEGSPPVPDDGTVESHVNSGANTGGYAYSSTKPAYGPWTENYNLAAGSNQLKVWSADYIEFVGGTTQTRNWGDMPNSLVFKVNLSDNITSATWSPARLWCYISGDGAVQLKYSTDGVNFTTLYTVPAPLTGYITPPTLSMSIPAGTNALYFGYFGTLTPGTDGHDEFQTESTGALTFTPQPVDPTAYWTMVAYADNATMMNVNGGTHMGGQAYTSTKPLSGDWTFHYPGGATPSTPLKVWAAQFLTFNGGSVNNIYNGGWGTQDNSYVMKINLGSPISSATWTPTRYYYVKTDDVSHVQLKYSTDGVNWTVCWDAPNNDGVYYTYPGTLSLTFPSPTQTLYIAYTGTPGTGTYSYWEAYDGSLTFYPAYALTRCVYADNATQMNINNGTNQGHYAYYSTKSSSWTEQYFFNTPVNVWAGDYLQFNPGQIESVPWGIDNSTLIFRINLSDNISAATWQPARLYRYVTGSGSAQLGYSTDGVNFTMLYSLPAGGGYDTATVNFALTLTMSFPGGTDHLYLGYFGRVAASGDHGMFQTESMGKLTFTPMVTAGTLAGTVTLGDFTGTVTGTPVTVELRGSTTRQDNVTLSSDGSFSISNVTPGTYNVWIKPSHWLAKIHPSSPVTVGLSTTTLSALSFVNGDVNNSNAITTADLSAVLAAMDTTSGTVDLDGDGAVTSTDLSIVLAHMDQSGTP